MTLVQSTIADVQNGKQNKLSKLQRKKAVLTCTPNTCLYPKQDSSPSIQWQSNENSSVIYITAEMVHNLQKLSVISKLPNNWNGYGATGFSSILIEKVKSILFRLRVQPSLFPTGRNSIQLEYEKENGDYLEFEIFENRTIMLKIFKSREIENEIDETSISEEVDEFYE